MNFGYGQPMYGQQPYYPQQPMGQLEQLRAQYQPMQQPNQPEPSGSGVIWVQGEAGAKSYMVARGNSVLLMDSEAQKFYIKSTDASGMPSMRAFAYTEITQGAKHPAAAPAGNDYVTRSELNALIAPLMDKIESLPVPRRKAKEVTPDGESAV